MKKKKLQELATIKFCTVSPSRAKEREEKTNWLPCTAFLLDNTVDLSPTVNRWVPPDELLIRPGDIVVKRISPTFVNYIEEIPDGFYAGNNLILITAKDGTSPKYLAMILNEKISEIAVATSVGAVMKSVSRTDLEDLEVPMIPYEKQCAVGELWYSSIELKKMKRTLLDLETKQNSMKIKKYLNSFGGKNNG